MFAVHNAFLSINRKSRSLSILPAIKRVKLAAKAHILTNCTPDFE